MKSLTSGDFQREPLVVFLFSFCDPWPLTWQLVIWLERIDDGSHPAIHPLRIRRLVLHLQSLLQQSFLWLRRQKARMSQTKDWKLHIIENYTGLKTTQDWKLHKIWNYAGLETTRDWKLHRSGSHTKLETMQDWKLHRIGSYKGLETTHDYKLHRIGNNTWLESTQDWKLHRIWNYAALETTEDCRIENYTALETTQFNNSFGLETP